MIRLKIIGKYQYIIKHIYNDLDFRLRIVHDSRVSHTILHMHFTRLSGFCRVALFVLSICCVFVGPAYSVPAIFSSTESAESGNIIGFQGGGFGASPQLLIATVDHMGVDGSHMSLPLVDSGDTFVAAGIPLGHAFGLYKVWIKDGSAVSSAPVFVNKARITSFEYPEVDAGREFRLFGRNLVLSGGTPSVRFVDVTTLASLPGSVLSGGDKYVVKVQAPASLIAGHTYRILYNNGYGGSVGETEAPLSLTARTGGMDPFAIGVPWGADFSSFSANVYNLKTDSRLGLHAAGNGSTDDTLAIQGAINAAASAGGGVVYFPSGDYRISTFAGGGALTLKANVVLQGSGSSSTTLSFMPPTSIVGVQGMIQAANGASTMGILDTTIRNMTTVTGGGLNYLISTNGSDTSKLFLLRVVLDGGKWANGGVRLTAMTGGRFLVSHCTFKNLRRDGRTLQLKDFGNAQNTTQYVYFRNNSISNFNTGLQLGGRNVIYENNDLVYDGDYYTELVNTLGQTQGGGLRNRISLSGPNNVVLDNTFRHVGAAFINQNDGENILAEEPGLAGSAPPDLASVTSVTSTSVSDSAKTWLSNAYAGYDIVLIAGPGKGQKKKVVSNSSNTLTVDSPWEIIPDATSKLLVTRMNVPHVLIKGNTILNKPKSIVLFQGAYDAAIVENSSTDSADIWTRCILGYSGGSTNPLANVLLRVLIANNSVTATSYNRPSCFQTEVAYQQATRIGTGAFLLEFRDNVLIAKGIEGFQAINTLATGYYFWHPQGDSDPKAFEGIIYDGNSVSDAITAYGHLPGVNGMVVGNYINTDIKRVSYNLTYADGVLLDGNLFGGRMIDGDASLGSLWLPGETMTVEGKFRTTNVSSEMKVFGNTPSGGGSVTLLPNGRLKVYDAYSAWTSGSVQSPLSYNDGVWHHFAWVNDLTENKIFIDGSLQTTITRPTRISSTGFGWLGGSTFDGELDEIRVWGSVRTLSEILKYKDTQLAGDEPELIQYWRFNEASGNVALNGMLSEAATTGLVGYWRFDENTGTIATDGSGGGHAGSLVGSAVWAQGAFGPAVDFNGSTGYVSVADAPAFGGTSGLTVHSRVKLNSISAVWNQNYRGIVGKGDLSNTGTLGWELGTSAGVSAPTQVGFYFRRGAGSGNISAFGTANLEVGKYYAVDATYDSATNVMHLYVDGVLQASVTNANPLLAASAPLTIGRRTAGGGCFFDGVIDDVRIYNRALTIEEIREISAP